MSTINLDRVNLKLEELAETMNDYIKESRAINNRVYDSINIKIVPTLDKNNDLCLNPVEVEEPEATTINMDEVIKPKTTPTVESNEMQQDDDDVSCSVYIDKGSEANTDSDSDNESDYSISEYKDTSLSIGNIINEIKDFGSVLYHTFVHTFNWS